MTSPHSDAPTLAELLRPEAPQAVPGVEGPLISGALTPDRGIVTDPGTGVTVLVPSLRLLRGTVEYLAHLEACRALLAPAAGDQEELRRLVELEVEDIVHELEHEAFDADAAGGDAAVDECIRVGLLPRAVRIWAALDAYGFLVNGRAPRAGDDLRAATEDMFEDADVYGDDGRELVTVLWDLLEGEMHSAEVHERFRAEMDHLAQRRMKPVSKKAKKHAARKG